MVVSSGINIDLTDPTDCSEDPIVIRADGLCKRFRLYRHPSDRLKEIILRRPYHHVHQALQDVTFDVPQGGTLGIIGHNGAGKSTLLKLLTGVLLPDSGQIESGGRITGLLELGTGFNPELSGTQNLTNNALLIGLTQDQIAERREAILDFSELGNFIQEPLKTYSSGMIMRLAFSIAIHADPDTFLVDEALAVGDAHFQQKCYRRIREFRESGGSIVLVSHDLNAVKMLCDRVLLLEHGKLYTIGEPERTINLYNYLVARQSDDSLQITEQDRARTDYGTGDAEILSARVVGADSGAETISSGESVTVRINYRIHRDLPEITAGILIRDRFGQDIFGTNTRYLDLALPTSKGEWQIDFTMDMDVAPGQYTLSAALHSEENHLDACYHWRDHAVTFEVAGIRGPLFAGVCRLRPVSQLHPIPLD
ncbi:ABC transporter ATP-binding protein [Thiocystis violacea]|uniref:ABC transporter ATP-binding protein n=1 Tax=Thiocystis violacea TaxID=13725 RepID=UPI0019052952|nr:ABC transporter ATP-binding protein [Thiocystis violacea]MBK1723516.1 ABC transporter ATP-binding protein [Thiocystis violacea]